MEGCRRSRVLLLLQHAPVLPLHPPCAHQYGSVDPIQVPSRYKHVTPGKERVGAVTLLQYHYSVPHMAMKEADPEVGPNQGPPRTSLYRARYLS